MVVSASWSEDQLLVNIHPNPAKDFFTLQTNCVSDIQYAFYTVAGKSVQLPVQQSGNGFRFNLNGLASGLYLVEVQCGKSSVRKALVRH